MSRIQKEIRVPEHALNAQVCSKRRFQATFGPVRRQMSSFLLLVHFKDLQKSGCIPYRPVQQIEADVTPCSCYMLLSVYMRI